MISCFIDEPGEEVHFLRVYLHLTNRCLQSVPSNKASSLHNESHLNARVGEEETVEA